MEQQSNLEKKIGAVDNISVTSKLIRGTKKDDREGELYRKTFITVEAEIPAGYLDDIINEVLIGSRNVEVTFSVVNMNF